MKKIFNQTIIVFIVSSLISAGQVLAQNVAETQATGAELRQEDAERAIKISEQEAKMVQDRARAAEKQLLVAEDQIGTTMYGEMLSNIRSTGVTLPHLHRGSSGSVLVIPSDQMKIENLAAITEDMNVMARIFDKKLSQSNVTTEKEKWFLERYYWLARGGSSATEAIYLEGYGALFLIKVNVLLSAPPEAPQKEKTEEEDTDPIWVQMRREMYEPEEVRRSRVGDRPEEEYDAEKVENFKTSLIKTLKHATNIRDLKPEQLVILTVIGNGRQFDKIVTRSYSSYSRSTGRRRVVRATPVDGEDSLLPTVLTICAKKSDIDAFAKGEIDYDQFSKRIGIFKSYAKAGQRTSPGLEEYKVASESKPVF